MAAVDRLERTLRALATAALVLVLVAMVFAALNIIHEDTRSAFGLGATLALLPVPIYLWVVAWIDRFEPEPARLLVLMFAWGAGIAFAVAYALNTAGTRAIGELRGLDVAGVYFGTVSAPIVEEVLKAVPLVALLVLAREHLDDLLDGLVYAAVIGLGFATSENILYYGREALWRGLPETLELFVLRGVWSPFMHPLFTAATGVGVAYAARRAAPERLRRAAPIAGLAAAIVLHSVWNTGARSEWFDVMYYLLFLPLFALLAVAVVATRRRQSLVLSEQLPSALARPTRVVAELGSLQGRRALRAVARRIGGRDGRRAAVAYEHAAVQLAFLERRIEEGYADRDRVSARLLDLRRRTLGHEDELRRQGVLPGVGDPGTPRGRALFRQRVAIWFGVTTAGDLAVRVTNVGRRPLIVTPRLCGRRGGGVELRPGTATRLEPGRSLEQPVAPATLAEHVAAGRAWVCAAGRRRPIPPGLLRHLLEGSSAYWRRSG